MTTLTPAAAGIQVFDDVLVDALAYRAAALAQSFGDFVAGDDAFHGIAACLDPTLLARITSELVPGAVITLSFFRKSPAEQEEPNFIHSDRDMGDWTGILYLNPDPPVGDGTSFWRHRVTSAIAGDFDVAEARDVTLWERWQHVDAKFGRLLIFQADYFHSRGLEQNYGQDDDARLIQVIFGQQAPAAGETLIRTATLADVPRIVEMGRRFLASSSYRDRLAENPAQMAATATWLLQSPDRALFVVQRDAQLLGMIGLALAPHPLSGELAATELFWWVEPEARGRTGLRLLTHAERWAEEAGAVLMQMVAPHADVERVYEKRGYVAIERGFQKRFGGQESWQPSAQR